MFWVLYEEGTCANACWCILMNIFNNVCVYLKACYFMSSILSIFKETNFFLKKVKWLVFTLCLC